MNEPISLQLSPPRPVEEILEELDFWTGRTKRALVHEAIERYGAIAPRLLALIDQVLADPAGYLNEDHDLLPYALVLLAHFRDERAHQPMLALFSLPGELTHELFGDMRTSGLPYLLLRTCGGSLEGIRALVQNRQADEFVRWAAMETLVAAVHAGLAERRETMAFLAGLLTGDEDDHLDSHFWSGAVDCLYDLYPDEVMETIDQAYAAGLVSPEVISPEDLRRCLDAGLEATLEQGRRALAWKIPDDIDDALAWCESLVDQSAPSSKGEKRSGKKMTKQRKQKRKIAKASKRRNR